MKTNEIDNRLTEADNTYNVGPIAQTLLDILKEEPTLTFADLEKRLRAIKSNTYLVALPAPPPAGLRCRMPVSRASADYWLWICLHGAKEMREGLFKIGRNEEDNLTALARCGILVKPEKKADN
jgi:hypothetical protein